MPTFDDATHASAPVEEVWKLLYDPGRFPEWWQGIESVALGAGGERGGDVTVYPEGYPDFPMPQALRTDRAGRRVTVSCLVGDLEFAWGLEPVGGGDATRISVHVAIPEREAHRLEGQREVVASSLRALVDLAEATAAPRARG